MLTALAAIWLVHFAALLIPGANTLLVSHLAASGHRRQAAFAALGIAIGAAIWSSAAVLGVSALFAAFPAARLTLQIAGAGYLLYVALRVWRSRSAAPHASASGIAARAIQAGVLTNLANPKSALFFGSVFSAAMPAHPDAAMIIAAVVLVFVNALCWHPLLAFLFSHGAVQAGYATCRVTLSRVAGAIVGVLGLALLVESLRETGQ